MSFTTGIDHPGMRPLSMSCGAIGATVCMHIAAISGSASTRRQFSMASRWGHTSTFVVRGASSKRRLQSPAGWGGRKVMFIGSASHRLHLARPFRRTARAASSRSTWGLKSRSWRLWKQLESMCQICAVAACAGSVKRNLSRVRQITAIAFSTMLRGLERSCHASPAHEAFVSF